MTDEDSDRSLPPVLRELAESALTAGFDHVVAHFESGGYDFPAPIGWLLHLNRHDRGYLHYLSECGDEAEKEAAARAEEEHTSVLVFAKVGREPYALGWTLEALREQIATPSDPALDHPSLTESEVAARDEMAQRMLGAWALGWSVERGLERPIGALSRGSKYTFRAHNWYYNDEGHQAHRDTGAEVELDIRASRHGWDGTWHHVSDGMGADNRPHDLPIEEVFDRVSKDPPWHARVALYDEEREKWVL